MQSLALVWLLAWPGMVPVRAHGPEVTLTYLGNMGVVIEAGEDLIVIDGLHRGELADYAAIPDALLAPLEGAGEPFRSLTAALTTHRHRDHFNAASVAARLGADSTVEYIAARETVDTLVARTGLPPFPARVRAVSLSRVGETRFAVGGASVTVLSLPHNSTPTAGVANVGFLIEVGGLRILHVGDADPAAQNFLPYRLPDRGVDVAIVPFWYLTGEDATTRTSIGARRWVASHIPPADTALVRRQVLGRVPGSIVLAAPGERYQLP